MVRVPVGRASRNLPRIVWFAFLGVIISCGGLPFARAQAPAATPQASPPDTSQNAPKPNAKAANNEIVSHDSPATFKVRVNIVLVRVVVRDSNGKVVSNLKKEDFQIADNRKPQVISSFSMETPASHVTAAKTDSPESTSEGTPVKPLELPQRFVASMLSGKQRVLDLRSKDATLERVNKTGLNVKLNFDLQPGTFLIRTVVRDSGGAQMGAANREVVIP